MGKKYLNMELGTYKVNQKQNTISLELTKEQFESDSIYDFEEITEADERFLPVNISEEDSKFIFNFEKFPELKNLKDVIKEPKAVRLSIAKTILEQRILETSGFDYVSLNPSSIWYLPMRTVKYSYRANTLMPITSNDTFLMYKAVILYVLTGCPYERLLEDYRALEKLTQKNPYLAEIVEADNISLLSNILKQTEDVITYSEWNTISTKQNNLKKGLIVLGSALLLTNLVTATVVTKRQNTKQEAEIAKLKNQYEQENVKKQIKEAIANNDFDKAVEIMKSAKYSSKKISSILFANKQYQKALMYNDEMLEKVISTYWNNDEQEKVLDLKLPKKASSENSDKLALEKAIVSYNTETMQSELAFTEDGNTLLRMFISYLNNDSLTSANSVLDKLSSIGASKQYDYANAMYNVYITNSSIEEEEQKLAEAKNLSDSDSNKSNQVKEHESKLEDLKSTLNDYQLDLEKAKKSLK